MSGALDAGLISAAGEWNGAAAGDTSEVSGPSPRRRDGCRMAYDKGLPEYTMPIQTLRFLTARRRRPWADQALGLVLAAVAGAANAGGFVAVHQYTSHMTGIVSQMADALAVGAGAVVLSGLAAVLSFTAGALTTTLLILWGRQRHLRSEFATPLLLEAAAMLTFGLAGSRLATHDWLYLPATVSLLTFMMGLQNAMISKVSHGVIRTTHVTGTVTDIGIELGRALYRRFAGRGAASVRVHFGRLGLLLGLLLMFFAGGVAGALAFARFGYVTTVALAAVLLLLAGVPALDDVVLRWRHWRERFSPPA